MTEWRQVPLGEVCELKRGYDLPGRARESGVVPVISSSGVTGYHSTAKVAGPGVVTGRYGTLGHVFYVESDFWPLNTSLYVRDFKGNDPQFVAALLTSMDLAQHDGAAAVPGLNRNQLHTVQVTLPPRDTQSRVARILRTFSDLIEINRRRVDVLEEMARAIYREWFVHFRFPGHENATFVDSDLGPIPDGWRCAPLEELADARRGMSWSRDLESDSNEGVPVVTIPNLGTRLSLSGCTKLKEVSANDLARFSMRRHDILLVGSNGNPDRVGHSVRVPQDTGALFASFIMRVRAREGSIDPTLLFHQLQDASGIIGALRATAVGATGLRNLRITALRSATVLVPSKEVSDSFGRYARSILGISDLLHAQTSVLAAMRGMLLPKLVTGQIDVSDLDLDAVVERVAG